MSDQEYTFNCPRCGNELKSKSRYCMKCGYLNPSHPSNQDYLKRYGQDITEEYVVSQDGSMSSTTIQKNSKGVDLSFSSDTGSFTLCFLVNFLLYLIVVLVIGYSYYNQYSGNVYAIMSSDISIILLPVSLTFLLEYSFQLMFMKMNMRWWLALIPFVNVYCLCNAVNESGLFNLIVFFPIIGEFYLLYIWCKIAKGFHKSALLTLIFPEIMIPIIGFGGSCFNDVCYITEKDSLEKEYSKKRIFLGLCSFVMVVCVVLFTYSNFVSRDGKISRINNYYLYYASKIIVRETQKKVESNSFRCKGENKEMYFYYEDVEDYFYIPFYVYNDPIEAYVKVVPSIGKDSYLYYISITNKHYGFSETSSDLLKLDTIRDYSSLKFNEKDVNQCFLK